VRAGSRNLTLLGCCLFSLLFAPRCSAKPPKVISSIPENGDINIDPTRREIQITFDQAMSPGGQSIVGGGKSFPELLGKRPGTWRGSRTFILRVRLKPNHSYWLSANSQKFQNFRNRRGEPAVPYPIQFTTGAGDSAKETPAGKAADNVAAIDQLKQALANRYSYRDRLGIDWPLQLESNRVQLEAATDARAFARLAATLLSKAQDKHLWLTVGEETFPTYVRPVTPNVNAARLRELVPHWQQFSPALASGRWEDGIGYVLIDTWSRDRTDELAPVFEILEQLKGAPALIIDVRGNGGGDEKIARSVAGCFIEKPTVYAQHVIVDPDEPNGFSEPHERIIRPNDRRTAYRGKVAVLTGPANMSSCEAFLLMMKQVPNAVLVGAASQGSSGNPQPVELDNGVTALLPSWKAMTPDGTELEGVGIEPDIRVKATGKEFEKADPVIDAALVHLRSQANQ
jgi:carboxyl-terminal processing protease